MTRSAASTMRCALAAVALAITWLGAAHAETGPYYVGVRETVTRDSNVYRSSTALADYYLSTGVFGGLDQTLGRQRLSGNLQANWNKYRNYDRLNHTDGNGSLRLDWETIERLSGDVQLSHSQQLYRDFSQAGDASEKVIVKSTDAAFNARLGVVTRLTLEAGVFGSRTRYAGGQDSLRNADINYDGYRAGLRYHPSSLLTLGTSLRHTHGEYPHALDANGASLRSDFDRDDVTLSGTWNATGTSTLSGHVSRSRLSYEAASARSTTLTTGAVDYRWRPGGRMALAASFKRDSNAGQYVFDSFAIVDNQIVLLNNQAVDTRVANTLGLNAIYDLTAKIRLSLDLRHTERDLDNALTQTRLGAPATTVRATSDRTNSATLSASYDPTRSIQLRCSVSRTERSGGDPAAQLTYPYAVNLMSCSAQVAVQP